MKLTKELEAEIRAMINPVYMNAKGTEACAALAEGATAYTQFQTVEHYKISTFIAAVIRERSDA